MIKPIKFSDVSAFQPANYSYFASLKKQGVRFNFTKLTEGTFYTNPSAFAGQIRNPLRVFGSVGVYHYWHGENADYFLQQFRRTGLDPKTTKFALDVEEKSLPYYLAGYINSFFKQLINYGFKPGNLWTYTNTAQFLRTGRIIVSHLKYGFVWAAQYPTMSQYYNDKLSAWSSFRPSANAWQYNGTGQDLSYDYTGSLLNDGGKSKPTPKKHVIFKRKPVRKIAPKEVNHYFKDGSYFKTLTTLYGHSDLSFHVKNGNDLTKGSVIHGKPVKYGSLTRLNTPLGFYTANTKYLKKIK